MPLLVDTFIEVAPSKRENKNSSEISLQTASILKCILDIILLLWKIFQNSDNPSEMVCIISYKKLSPFDSINDNYINF